VRASILISPEASDEVHFDGVNAIEGDLVVRGCQHSGCANEILTKISSSTLRLVEGDIIIEDLNKLEEVSVPALGKVQGVVSAKNLTSLETLKLDALSTVSNFSLAEVEQLYYLNLGIAQAEDISVAGNGNMVLQLGSTNGSDPNLISRLDIAGVGELRWGSSVNRIAVGELAVHDSTIELLPLLFSSIRNLVVWQNSQLTDILFPAEEESKTRLVSLLKQILVTDNERLNMTTIHNGSWNNTDMLSWVWPGENMDTVVLDGIIHNAFL
jgi:hypothetical protein